MIKIGCCGWAEGQRSYHQDFDVVEVQETFYQPGRLEKYKKWRRAAPPAFEFSLKAWQLITHEPYSPTYRKLKTPVPEGKKNRYGSFRPTEEVFAAWEVTDMVAEALGAKVIVFQSPPGFAASAENRKHLRKFFLAIDRKDYLLCWEPRGGWEEKDIKGVCRDLDLVHCVDPFTARPLHGRVRYFRLHGRPGYNLRYRYGEQDLRELAGMIDRGTAYVLFNNLSTLDDARRFRRLVR